MPEVAGSPERPPAASPISRSSSHDRKYDRKDHFHQRAKREGYRSRAAYKLADLQRKHRLLGRGQRVVDLGCWPGGFLQVAAEWVGPRGIVVGVDVAETEPFENENVIAIQADLEDPNICERVLERLGGELADVVLCDAAPKLTGVRERDRAAEARLLEAVEATLPRLLRPGGDLLVKILDGPEAQEIDRRIRRSFEKAKTVKSAATRKGSSERYLLARGHRPRVD